MSTPPLILHHYDFSNFSEKVRLVLGLKRLRWCSVTIPNIAPKPDYTPLTGGYRRTPALQVGADIYCDTRLICDVLDAWHPRPPLWRDAVQAAEGEAWIHWVERGIFWPLALYITGLHAERFPAEFHADRARLHNKPTPSVAQVKASASKYRPQVGPALETIETLFGDGREWVLGSGPSLADFVVYLAPWFLETIGGPGTEPTPGAATRAWMARVAAIGHGEATPMSAEAALDCARDSTPAAIERAVVDVPEHLEVGDPVVVRAFNEDTAARGRLLRLDANIVSLACDGRAGAVHVHFPRLGYRVSRERV